MDLPAQHAFVVQLTSDTDVEAGRMAGRVEHLVSHRTTRFESFAELVSAMSELLRQAARLAGEQTLDCSANA